jgi:hypothetical protein
MEPTDELIDSIYLEKVQRARRTPISEKLMAGPRLFAFSCEASRAGIRLQNPKASPAEVELLLRKRLELRQHLEGHFSD